MRRDETEVVGVLGGTFDPIHNGHLHIARRACRLLGLERLLLVPTANPPHKPVDALTPAVHRLAMVELAAREEARLAVSYVELTRERSYTIDTLRGLAAGDPPCRPVFVVGMDALLQIGSWRDSAALLTEFDLAAVDRRGAELARIADRLPAALAARIVRVVEAGTEDGPQRVGAGGRIFHLAGPPVPVSSSTIRARAARREPISDLVPPGVAEYIQRMGLYRREGER